MFDIAHGFRAASKASKWTNISIQHPWCEAQNHMDAAIHRITQMALNLVAMASTLAAMASNLISSDGL